MRKVLLSLVLFWCAVASITSCCAAAPIPKIREPGVAGTFYPQDAKELAATVDGFIAQAQVGPPNGEIVALIAPHAGYQFSGRIAAYSYALLRGKTFHRVVVIAPSHYEAFDFASVYDGDEYETPLGKIPVDTAFVRKLASLSPRIKLSARGHEPAEGHAEHALEVQLPFLQRSLTDFVLVPVVMGDQSYEASRALGVALAQLTTGTDTLIVASSDLSHFHPYDEATKLDGKTLNAIHEWDYLALSKNFQTRTWEACGGAPIVAAMIAAERLGAHRADILKYANSGDVTADRNRVVGYGAVALLRATGHEIGGTREFNLGSREKKALLDLARRSVETAVKERKLLQIPGDLPEALNQDRGAFVTLHKGGELRGCIGYVTPRQSLAWTVRDVAVFAALEDPRFSPVESAELPQLTYEISVLSPMRRMMDVKQIKVGQHGLLIRNAGREGLLLPQVAVEQSWDRNTLLQETALKAGLPADAWRDPDSDIFMFTAQVFGDAGPAAATSGDSLWPKPSNRPEELRQGLPHQ